MRDTDYISHVVLYVALSFGFSLAVNIQIFAGVSGGVFNPAISFGLALIGAHTPVRAIILTTGERYSVPSLQLKFAR